ncbi:hypothetical protein ACM64Y_01765 [Novispirillum sp. DQ9]|uniref:hypothetical protein n=1 Tax=Novispirillum sp. DQ9 TaxID=3398612 RepID=UPI003C7C9876
MQGVVAAPRRSSASPTNDNSRTASPGGALRAAYRSDYLLEANTGWRRRDLEGWVEKRADRERLRADTERLADILEAHGVEARQESTVHAVGLVTGLVDELEAYRNVNFLPLVAARNRAAPIREIKKWLKDHPEVARFARYGVITSGRRVPLFGDLRGRVTGFHRAMSKWVHECRHTWRVEVLHGQTELTVDEEPSLHVHGNVIYAPMRKMREGEWADFLTWTRDHFGAHWRDCGRLQDVEEVVKYCLKGDDVGLLADLACLVPEWADADTFAAVPELAKRRSVRTGAPVEICDDAAVAHLERLAPRLQRQAESYPHPVKWLAEQLQGLHLGRSYGALKEYRSSLRKDGLKVAALRRGDGARLVEVQKTKKDRPDPDRQRERAEENCILGITLPSPRFTPWSEPVALVAHWQPEPRTGDGRHALEVLGDFARASRGAWDRAGAPDPATALARVRMTVSGVLGPDAQVTLPKSSGAPWAVKKGQGVAGGDGGRPLAGSGDPAPLYGPHHYENCPAPRSSQPRSGWSGWDEWAERNPEAVAAMEHSVNLFPELDPYHPDNWLPADAGKPDRATWVQQNTVEGFGTALHELRQVWDSQAIGERWMHVEAFRRARDNAERWYDKFFGEN